MQQQCSHGVRFPVVNEIMVDNRIIPILCAGNYAQAKQRLFQYAQSIPANGTTAQGGKNTNGKQSNHMVTGRAARAAASDRRDCGAASPFGGATLDAGNGVADFGGDGSGGVEVMV